MKVKFIRDEEFIQETWLNENEKGQVITIHKGETFNTGAWGYGGIESVLTDKGEWICDCDCRGFDELFEIEDINIKVVKDAIDYLLGADLREENGWTEKEIEALERLRDKNFKVIFEEE